MKNYDDEIERIISRVKKHSPIFLSDISGEIRTVKEDRGKFEYWWQGICIDIKHGNYSITSTTDLELARCQHDFTLIPVSDAIRELTRLQQRIINEQGQVTTA